MNPAEKVQIDFIVDHLRNGLTRKDIMGKFGEVWVKASKNTFDRRLNAARKLFRGEQERIQALAEQKVIKDADALSVKIMSLIERQHVLQQIATGQLKVKKPYVINGKIMEYPSEPDHTDRKNAIAELNKMDGSYAATKIEATVSPIKTLIIEPASKDKGK